MRQEIHIVPETDEEIELVERLSEAREYSLNEVGMSEEEMAAVFAQFAVGMHMEGMPEESTVEHVCPECGASIDDVSSPGLGELPIAEPCGCELSYKDVPEELYLGSS